MDTPMLTKKQQRHTLSAKKAPVRGLRNILAQPSEIHWPTVNIDEYPTLITLINKLLLLIRRPKFTIPGSMLKHMSKEKRALARKEALEKETEKPNDDNLKSVILGINAVTRALEKDNVCCLLLDANVEPRFLIKHIVVMAQNKKVPVLLLSDLKIVSLQTIGFPTAAFALMRNVMESQNNPFYALYTLVSEVFKDFKLPKCSLQLFKFDQASEDNTISQEEILDVNCDSTLSASKSEKSVIVFKNVYKYRTSREERAFIPPTVNPNHQTLQTTLNEFIALDNDSDNDKKYGNIKNKNYTNVDEVDKIESINTEECDMKSTLNESEFEDSSTLLEKNKVTVTKKRKNTYIKYLPLKVKRIQGSSNRRKVTKLSKKKKKQ